MLRTVLRAPGALRVVTVILAMVTMLCVSAASVSAAHTHLKEPVDRCSVCSTAHQATQQVAAIEVIHAPEPERFVAPVIAVQRLESRGVLALLTRGPPSILS